MTHEADRATPGGVPARPAAGRLDAGVQPCLLGDVAGAVRGDGREPCRGAREGGLETAPSVHFVIPGTPVAKGRPKFARRGNFVTTYTPEKTASYENLVRVKAEEAMRNRPVIEGAVAVCIRLFVAPPASWSLKKQRAALAGEILPTSKPDADNCVKGIFDAMNEIVFRDDKQVVDLVVSKRYALTAMAKIEVTPL